MIKIGVVIIRFVNFIYSYSCLSINQSIKQSINHIYLSIIHLIHQSNQLYTLTENIYHIHPSIKYTIMILPCRTRAIPDNLNIVCAVNTVNRTEI